MKSKSKSQNQETFSKPHMPSHMIIENFLFHSFSILNSPFLKWVFVIVLGAVHAAAGLDEQARTGATAVVRHRLPASR